MNPKSITMLSTVSALIMLCGCSSTPVTHNVAYSLDPYVAKASARYTMQPIKSTVETAVVCAGSRATANNIATVSYYHCDGREPKKTVSQNLGMVGSIHVLQTPEPIGKYVERAAAAALASQGVGQNSQSSKKVLLQLERFDYDENSDTKHGPIMPWSGFTDRDGVVRKGFMDVVIKVAQDDGTIAYQRRVSVEVSRKRGQASSGALIAGVLIAQVSPVTINPEAFREKEEKNVTEDVMAELFSKFQDELVADQDLLQAIRK